MFLHGAERTTAGVSIVWRGDISNSDLTEANGNGLTELIRLVPPRADESIEIPLWTARAWLNKVEDVPADMSDAPEVPKREFEARGAIQNRKTGRRAFRWAGPDDRRTGIVRADELRTGDLLVVPSTYGGCDRFGWAPDSLESVRDVADKAAKAFWGRRCAVRVARDIVHKDAHAQWDRILAALAVEGVGSGELVDSLIEALPPAVTEEEEEGGGRSDSPMPRDVRSLLEPLRWPKGSIDVHFPYAGGRAGGAVLVADRGIKHVEALAGGIPATEDESASSTSAKPVPLDDHGCRVAKLAEGFAGILGLEETVNDLGLAAFLHDAGKADPRFQIMLSGGDPWNRPDGSPLAKSSRSWSPTAWRSAGLPERWRHEALSVRMARVHPRLAEARDPGLVLWLIGSHHGLGRPFFNFFDEEPEQPLPCLDVANWQLPPNQSGPQSLAFDLDGIDWPSLFENLKRTYGIWELAHLETILRLADHRASEKEREF